MKISKSLMAASLLALSQPVNQHSSRGNSLVESNSSFVVRGKWGDKAKFTGKQVGKTKQGYTIHAGKSHDLRIGKHGDSHHVWVMDGDKLHANHSTNDSAEHKMAISHAKTTDRFWDDKEKHKAFHLRHQDEPRVIKEDEELEETAKWDPHVGYVGGASDEFDVDHKGRAVHGYKVSKTGHNERVKPYVSGKVKHYHTVPYKDKEHAKGEGMKWDSEKKKWYHQDAGKSATSKFKKLNEEQHIKESKADHHALLSHIKSAGYEVTGEHDASKDPKYKDSKDHRVWLRHKDGRPHDSDKMREHMHDKFQAFGGKIDGGYRLRGKHGNVKWSLSSLHHSADGHVMLTTYPKKLHEEDEQIDESWIHVKSHDEFLKHVKANHPDATHVHHDNKISQAVVGPRKNPVGHWDDELGVGRVRKTHLGEDEMQPDFELVEEHSTEEQAREAMAKHEKKHPNAKHTVMQGRRTGKWHVVRHTSGGMHIIEGKDGFPDHHDHIASLTSDGQAERMHEMPKEHQKKIKAFVKSKHWKAVDKKHTDPHTGEMNAGGHVDDDFHAAYKKWHKETHGTAAKTVNPVNESINEGDESEKDYQDYLKSLKEKGKKKVSIIKELIKGK